MDIRRAGDPACPAGLYAIKSQPRAAVLQGNEPSPVPVGGEKTSAAF